MIDDAVANARRYFSGNHNCAQSVMKAMLVETKMDFDQVIPLTAGLGGGVAHEGSVCGAVTGAIAALGVLNSRHYTDLVKHKEAAYKDSEEFIRRFKEVHGSVHCNDLTGIEMADLKARQKAMEGGLFAQRCPKFVENAVRIALEISEQQ